VLAEMWIEADEPAAVTVASNAIDKLLKTTPWQAGIGSAHQDRIVFEPPLGVVFSIDEGKRIVTITKYIYLG